jgi:hypothetical protein
MRRHPDRSEYVWNHAPEEEALQKSQGVRAAPDLFSNPSDSAPLSALSQSGEKKGIDDIVKEYGWAGAAAMLGMSVDDLQAQANSSQTRSPRSGLLTLPN